MDIEHPLSGMTLYGMQHLNQTCFLTRYGMELVHGISARMDALSQQHELYNQRMQLEQEAHSRYYEEHLQRTNDLLDRLAEPYGLIDYHHDDYEDFDDKFNGHYGNYDDDEVPYWELRKYKR